MIVIGESGSGVEELAKVAAKKLQQSIQAIYKGSGKKFLQAIAIGMDIPIRDIDDEGTEGKELTLDMLKSEILENCANYTLIIPEAQRLPAGIRYWMIDCIGEGLRVCAFSPQNPRKDLFLDLIEVEMSLPSDDRIREIMRSESRRYNLNLSESDLSRLQPLAGKNPMIAKKVIRAEALGLKQDKPEHSQYLDIWPLVMAALAMLAILRFVGQGTNDRSLYLIGGMAMMTSMSLRYAGKIQGPRRNLQ